MFSNSKALFIRSGFALALSSLVLSTAACDRFLRGRSAEQEKAAQVVTISTDEVNCLKDTPAQLKKFFTDQGDDQTLSNTVGCVQTSLKTFLRLTRGSQPNGYLASEVQYFFNTFLMRENRISDAFLREIMKVKVAVVGGTDEVVSRHELEQFIEFLGLFQKQMQVLRGHMKTVFFQGAATSPGASIDVEKVQQDLLALTDFVLQNSKLTASRYQWVDLISFLKELKHFTGDSPELDEIFKWVPVAESVKLLFLGENAKLVSESDWQDVGHWTVRAYATALKFRYRIKDSPFQTPQEWDTLLTWLDEGLHVIETSPTMQNHKILEAQALDRLTDEIFKLDLFQTVLTPEIVKSVYRKALVHFIEAQSGRGDPLTVQGLTEAHFRVLMQEYNVWRLSQKFLIETYQQHPVLKLINLRWYVNRYDINRSLADMPLMEREAIERGWEDFRSLLNSQPAITYTDKTKVRIALRSEVENYPFVGANMMNGLRSFARLVLRGYGDQQSRFVFDNKITRQRLNNLEEDFRDFGRAVGLLDPRESNSASRTFDQGNFFTFHGNGDGVLTALETFEVFNMMVSGARTQLHELYADLNASHCTLTKRDIFAKPFVDEKCYLNLFLQRADVYLDNMPGMARFMKGLNPQQWAKIYQSLLSVCLSKNHQNGLLESSELRSINTLLHFVETLMVVYDKDQNGRLSEAEVLSALPRFGPFIQNMIAKKPSWVDRFAGPLFLEDILLYLVFEGHEPTGTQLMAFKTRRLLGLGEVGQENLITLLSVLNNLLNTTNLPANLPANAPR